MGSWLVNLTFLGLSLEEEDRDFQYFCFFRGLSRHTFLSPPKFMCPDASDPMMDLNGQPVQCGAGFDGMKLCPRGYYCAIDSEKDSRLCCPLFGQASRIPAEEMTAPYYKKQKVESRERTSKKSIFLFYKRNARLQST